MVCPSAPNHNSQTLDVRLLVIVRQMLVEELVGVAPPPDFGIPINLNYGSMVWYIP